MPDFAMDRQNADLENKIPKTDGLLKKTAYNTDKCEPETKTKSVKIMPVTPDSVGFIKKTEITEFLNRFSTLNKLVKKATCNTNKTTVEVKIKTVVSELFKYY